MRFSQRKVGLQNLTSARSLLRTTVPPEGRKGTEDHGRGAGRAHPHTGRSAKQSSSSRGRPFPP